MENCNLYLLSPYKIFTREELVDITGIYCFRNKINDKVYISQSNNIGWSIQHHILKIDDGLYFHNALKKYGYENFDIYLLEKFPYIDKYEQNKSEIYFISKFKSNNPKYGYNLTIGGDSGQDSMSEETKKKLKELHKCPCYGYNYITKKYYEADDAKLMTEQLIDEGFNDLNYYKVRNTANGCQKYTGDFLFSRNLADLQNKILTFVPPIKHKIYLYNYKKENSEILEFDSNKEAYNFLKNEGYDIYDSQIPIALEKNNKRIRDYLIASSRTRMLELINTESPYIYLYNIEHKFVLMFESCAEACRVLKSIGYTCNTSSFRKCKLGTQKQANGFIIGRNKQELMDRICYYTKSEIDTVAKLIKEYNLEDSQTTLNWADSLNETSVSF